MCLGRSVSGGVFSSLCWIGRACVWVGVEVRELFPVYVGLRPGCVMSSWLFSLIFMWMI